MTVGILLKGHFAAVWEFFAMPLKTVFHRKGLHFHSFSLFNLLIFVVQCLVELTQLGLFCIRDFQ